jgi:glycosyltransferase involved in cell wall biosynthesis
MARAAAARAETLAPPKPYSVDWWCPAFGPSDGYGQSSEQICLGLERAGANVKLVGITQKIGHLNAEAIWDRSQNAAANGAPPGEAIVFYGQPPGWMKQHGPRKAFGFSMFEATDIPDSWKPGLYSVDEIWVPSEFCHELFGRYAPPGRPVTVIPLGVDTNVFKPRKRTRGQKLRFVHDSTYASELRKGAALAIDSFIKAFPNRDDVELVVRSTFVHQLEKRDERVSFRTGHLTSNQLAAFFSEADCLIYPSRGEGFGLIPMEAMATGCPAIYPASTGMLDYCDLGLPVGVHASPSQIGNGRAGSQPWALVADWFEPDHDELVDRMRQVDADYDAVQKAAELDAAKIAQRWTWDNTVKAILERVEAHRS